MEVRTLEVRVGRFSQVVSSSVEPLGECVEGVRYLDLRMWSLELLACCCGIS